jgi:hypothetical protein
MQNLSKDQKAQLARFKQALKGTGLKLIDFESQETEGDIYNSEFRSGTLQLQRGSKTPKIYRVRFGWRHTEYNYELNLRVNGKGYASVECATTSEFEMISELMSIIKPHNKWAKNV